MMADPQWEDPICLAITEPILWGKVPRDWAGIELMLVTLLVVYQHYLGFIPLLLGIHLISAWWTKKDPQFFDVLREYCTLSGYYEP